MRNILYRKYIKRLLDIVLSATALVVLSPVMLVTALLIRIKLGKPVIFKQKRPGKDEKLFEMYKFRSMTEAKDNNGDMLPDEMRLTGFGKKLRETSIDELPEFFNILKGDMSIVGPRPQLVKDMVFMTPEQRKRHRILPGLTGLAQINGRNNISWEEKLRWDLQYIKYLSFRTDILIIVKTMGKVFGKKDISAEGKATAEDLGDYLLKNNIIAYEKYVVLQNKAKKILTEYKATSEAQG